MKMDVITEKKNELITRVLSEGHVASERDVAEAQELVNQYIDELERLENTATVSPSDGLIFSVTEFIFSKWHPNG